MNVILYINKTRHQWSMFPLDFAPWQSVYYYFRKWKLEGVIEDCTAHEKWTLKIAISSGKVLMDNQLSPNHCHSWQETSIRRAGMLEHVCFIDNESQMKTSMDAMPTNLSQLTRQWLFAMD